MPGMSEGSRTTYRARLFLVPASVMSRPEPSSRCTRAAIGDLLLGLGGSVGTSSRQRTQPARARCMTRCRPPALMSMNLPCRVTPSTKLPLQGGQRRVEGLQRAERRDVDAGDGASVESTGEVERQSFHFGQLGHSTILGLTHDSSGVSRHTVLMHPVAPLPSAGEVFLDARGDGRAMRVSWHAEADVVVLSLWSGGTCTGTFRLPVEDVPDMIDALRDGLARSYDVHRARLGRVDGPRAG